MTQKIDLQGSVIVGGGVCSCDDGQGTKIVPLAFRCGAGGYASVVSTDAPVQVSTVGLVGATWVDLPVTDALDQIELLLVQSQGPIALRFGADAATVLGVGGTFPTGFVGAETLTLTLDGNPLSVAFLVGDQTAAQVAARINSAAALASLPWMPASVATNGQVQLRGVLTGAQGSVVVTGGTGAATLGLSGKSAVGLGEDVGVDGMFLAQFGRAPSAAAPGRVQISGQSLVSVMAAGNTPSA